MLVENHGRDLYFLCERCDEILRHVARFKGFSCKNLRGSDEMPRRSFSNHTSMGSWLKHKIRWGSEPKNSDRTWSIWSRPHNYPLVQHDACFIWVLESPCDHCVTGWVDIWMARPVIFLDVDGVLHPGTYEAHKCQEMRLEHSEVILELRWAEAKCIWIIRFSEVSG